ncbi:sigma factor-like helix-turn-helix DNA-binding protein [Paenibacillus sedimenti]|uniref:sigma factor-like helix-turn-helix DNA-binding protein n=1 Tax=Paenibacillus sedimenti TaxID=2770274 RepID=UPI0028A237CB|nr:sigma factor-like helix-turn-helix DNA-binding protein [Paenibacillus sedimenti]
MVREADQTNGWLTHIRDLKKSYRGTYWMLRKALKACGEDETHPDYKTLKEMISDVNFAIMWMHTGKRPGNKRGIERRAAYQRDKLMDPLKMQAYVQQHHAGSPANISDDERFRLGEAMRCLSERERECYELAHGHGFPFQYIADMLQISKGSVEQYVRRAQEKISDELRGNLFL